MTDRQKIVAKRVVAVHPAWYRADGNGERVTLASLYRAGVLDRRARRGEEGSAAAAYEYRASNRFLEAIADLNIKRYS